MAALQGYPKWLLDSKENISGTVEWKAFLKELHDAIQQQLTESHVQYFTDLSEAEKELFMQRATKAIDGGSTYSNLYKKVSVLLDQNLNEETSRQLLEEHPIGTKSVPFWQMWKYNVSFQPYSNLRLLYHFDAGVFYAMKAVLSYYHASMRTKTRLRDVDHMLIVPFITVSAPNVPRKEPPTSRTVALLVEEFLTFQDTRPGFVVDSGSDTHEEEMRGFVDKVAKLLQQFYPETPKVIAEKYVPSKDKIVATEAGSYAVLKDGLTILIRPLIRSMFVGYLRMDTLLFVWDQYMIGLDSPGFNVELLAIITAIILGLLKDKFKECQTSVQLETMLRNEGPKLTIAQFQYEIKKNHYQELYAMLQKDFKSAMPVLDPTQAIHPPWRHWYNDLIPPYTQPHDRKTAREEREAERERLGQQQRDAALLRREHEQTQRNETGAQKKEDLEYMKLAAADRQRMELEKARLEDQLADERRQREEGERRAKEEIEQLKLQMAMMSSRRQPSRPPSTYSVSSYISRVLVPPPPSVASQTTMHTPVPVPARTPTPAQSPTDQFNHAMRDFLKKIADAQNKIAHAEGPDKEILDKKTEGYLHQNIRDIKQAQIELFGRKFEPGEFDRMPPAEQQDKSDKMMSTIQKWREERRAKELKQGIR
ncbi:uncharacterized protein LOC132719086 [Ruditapes philippinarum]|uniref:uncharacterized protein LOC132719086 n=1 Tax=Ruditapes philippinarum TaxID=129788 RepID=UPI00295A959B|nr:uncharacterized protein LOC132719086 [Ruditapes philippinarum]